MDGARAAAWGEVGGPVGAAALCRVKFLRIDGSFAFFGSNRDVI